MRFLYFAPLALIALVCVGSQSVHAYSTPDFLIDTSFFKYADPIPYTLKLHHQPDSTESFRYRFISNDTRMASEWSAIPLPGSKITGTINLAGQPFDKKGTYYLQTKFQAPKYSSRGLYEVQLLDDASQPILGKSHMLSPREQLYAQYIDSEIICKPGLSLEQKKRVGPTVCVSPESKSVLLKRGFLHDPSKDPDGLIFDKLKSVYGESEPINFDVWYKGIASKCFVPKIRITDDLGQTAWANDPNDVGCNYDAKENINTRYDVHERSFDHPILSAGKYTITAQFEGQQITKDITVN